MKFRPIIVDQTLQELTQHGTEEFPMSMDEQIVSHKQCGMVMHWHYEIQIALVTVGSVRFRTPAGEFLLHTGEGIFINSSCLHEAVPTEDVDSIYICVNFHPQLIFGHSRSMLRRDYVDPLLHCAQMQAIPLYQKPWHREICALLAKLAQVNNASEYGYEIAMQMILQEIWLILLTNNRHLIEDSASITFSDKQRMKALQQFIHKNYMDRITLADIAEAAHISRGECCRLFKRMLQSTPFLYLISYRVSQSVKMLSTTSLSIAEIAFQTGFGSSSYFTECFKKEMRCTPLEYRKQLRHRQAAEAARTETEKAVMLT